MTGPKPALHVQLGQHIALTPQLLQSIRMLQLATPELEMELRQALVNNVMLEEVTEDAEESEESAESSPEAAVAETPALVSGMDAGAHADLQPDYDWSSRESWSGGEPQDNEDEAFDARRAAPESTDIRVRALEQLRLSVRSDREARLALAIVEQVDDNGYLEVSLDMLLQSLDPALDTNLAELEQVLSLVQSVEPTGFGARDLRECLRLQLRERPVGVIRTLASHLIENALETLAGGDLSALATELGATPEQMAAAVDLILTLNPKPGAVSRADAEAAIPDVLISGQPGAWKVELNPETLPRLRINSLYERVISNASHRALKDQLMEARWLIRGLEMRQDTLMRTATAIFQRQRRFLDEGETAMAPLTLREVAEAIGMHESTVCRITRSKYVQTPWGVYEMKAFFPSHIQSESGELSGTAVRALIRRMIDTESRNAPLCDGDITALLLRNGIRVARRTVAKYREAMNIPSAKDRRPRVRRHALAAAI